MKTPRRCLYRSSPILRRGGPHEYPSSQAHRSRSARSSPLRRWQVSSVNEAVMECSAPVELADHYRCRVQSVGSVKDSIVGMCRRRRPSIERGLATQCRDQKYAPRELTVGSARLRPRFLICAGTTKGRESARTGVSAATREQLARACHKPVTRQGDRSRCEEQAALVWRMRPSSDPKGGQGR